MTAVLWIVCVGTADVHAQRLSIQSDRFAVDGSPRFLVFISMFGAMDAPDISADLHTLKTLGFDGFRIWPNLHGRLFNGDGTVRQDALSRLRAILDAAHAERLLVDVTFTHEHTPGLTPAGDRLAIVAVTEALQSYGHVLFDIQNERNVRDQRNMAEADVASIRAAIRSIDSTRIVVASNSPIDTPEYAAAFTARLGLDATAYHEPRSSSWYKPDVIRHVVRAMRANGKPAYLQEPMPTGDTFASYPSNDRAEFFIQAMDNAKRAGAAAWCFHTDVALDYRTGPRLLLDRLRARPEPEWAFVAMLQTRTTSPQPLAAAIMEN